MKCMLAHCDADAACAVMMRVPFIGMPIKEHDPLRVTMGLCVCRTHFPEVTPQEFLEDGNLQKIVLFTTPPGNPQPDFDRAFIERLEFDSQEWVTLLSTRVAHRQCQPPADQ